jgi:S-layer protein (TIGR01567 family)
MRSILIFAMLLLVAALPAESSEGTVEARGQTATLGSETFTWNPSNFPGFYYDINKNIGNEQMTLQFSNLDASMSAATLSDIEMGNGRGILYKTTAQMKNFEFKSWGSYMILGFLGEPYFAAYSGTTTAAMVDTGESGTPYLYDMSKSRNLMTNLQLTKILMDSDEGTTVSNGTPLKLKEGYELGIISVNVNETKVKVELRKDGRVVDTNIIQPGLAEATNADKTYYFKEDLGETKEIVIIAVHFKTLLHEAAGDSAIIDGIFQISDEPTSIDIDQQYGKLSIRNVDPSALTITMDNKDNQVAISRNMVAELMPGIYLRTADQGNVSADNPLRYYLYSLKPCVCGGASAQ